MWLVAHLHDGYLSENGFAEFDQLFISSYICELLNNLKMADNTIYKLHADVCKALGNPLRIQIIDLLQDNELTFSEILHKTKGLKSTLSQHLSVMVRKGILVQRKEGINVYFKLSSPKVAKACALMREVLIAYLKKHKNILKKMKN